MQARPYLVTSLICTGIALSSCAQLTGTQSSAAPSSPPQATADALWRLDCGNGFNDQRRFSDTFAYSDPKVPFTFSCYVIKHGDDYMVWDTGYLPGSNPNAPKVTLGRAARAAQRQARAGEVRRHQPFPRRPYRPARHGAERDAAHRREGMGRDHRAEADGGRQRRRLQALDQRRRQGRAAGRRQGRVRRRQRDDPAHARATRRGTRRCSCG